MWKGEKVEERWEMEKSGLDCWFVVLLLDRKRARTARTRQGVRGWVRVRDGQAKQ